MKIRMTSRCRVSPSLSTTTFFVRTINQVWNPRKIILLGSHRHQVVHHLSAGCSKRRFARRSGVGFNFPVKPTEKLCS
jgi:hypothetical protein